MACREVDASTGYPVRVFGDDAVDYLVEAGWAIEDPDPPAPELPSVEAELKMRDEEIERAAIRRDEAYDQYQRLQGTWIDLVVRRTQIAAAEAGRSQK